MAETKKKRPSGGRTTAARKSSSGRKGSSGKGKSSQSENGPDLLTIIVVAVAVVLVAILIINYKKEKNGDELPTPTGAVPTKELEQPTATPVPTKAPEHTATPSPTKQPEVTELVPTEELVLSWKEAQQRITDRIDTSVYSAELLNDALPLEGKEYYLFCIDDRDGKTYEPLIIVEKKEGGLHYYDTTNGTISEFTGFPLDATEKKDNGDSTITKERAVEILKSFSARKLGLEKEMDQYQTEVDTWSSIVMTKECYGISVFEVTGGKTRLRGAFYVSYDGESVYRQDSETNEFVEIKK